MTSIRQGRHPNTPWRPVRGTRLGRVRGRCRLAVFGNLQGHQAALRFALVAHDEVLLDDDPEQRIARLVGGVAGLFSCFFAAGRLKPRTSGAPPVGSPPHPATKVIKTRLAANTASATLHLIPFAEQLSLSHYSRSWVASALSARHPFSRNGGHARTAGPPFRTCHRPYRPVCKCPPRISHQRRRSSLYRAEPRPRETVVLSSIGSTPSGNRQAGQLPVPDAVKQLVRPAQSARIVAPAFRVTVGR